MTTPRSNFVGGFVRSLTFANGTVVLMLLCGCGASKSEIKFQQMIQEIQKKYKASDIRAAVTPLFSKHRQNPSEKIPVSELPKEITSLPLFSSDPKDIEVWGVRSDSDALMFVTGGGFGHWGIVVCRSENDQQVKTTLGHRLTAWGSGVYFYRE